MKKIFSGCEKHPTLIAVVAMILVLALDFALARSNYWGNSNTKEAYFVGAALVLPCFFINWVIAFAYLDHANKKSNAKLAETKELLNAKDQLIDRLENSIAANDSRVKAADAERKRYKLLDGQLSEKIREKEKSINELKREKLDFERSKDFFKSLYVPAAQPEDTDHDEAVRKFAATCFEFREFDLFDPICYRDDHNYRIWIRANAKDWLDITESRFPWSDLIRKDMATSGASDDDGDQPHRELDVPTGRMKHIEDEREDH